MVDTPGQKANQALQANVRARLEEQQHVRALGRYEVAVTDGRATLIGHVRSRQIARSMVDTARHVKGVSDVDERLVADDELEQRVASAIGNTKLNRVSRLVVRSEFGHVRIGGIYPSPEARADALRVGAEVPGVLATTAARASDLIS